MSTRSIGRYELHEVAGTGGFATVYRATDPRLDAPVAVKVLAENWSHDPEIRSRFRTEAVLLRRVQAEGLVPGMVEVFDIDESDDGRPFIVMGWADKGTLLERTADRAWTPHDVVPVVNSLADTLVALHRANVVHRDLKPSNLLLRSDRHAPSSTSGLIQSGERLLVGDLGLAKDLDSDASGISLLGGTDSFMAPEQTDPNLEVDHRTDVFGASAVVRRLLTGDPPGDLSPAIRTALDRGTAANPDDRQQTISEWRHEMLQAFGPTAPSPRSAVINPAPSEAPAATKQSVAETPAARPIAAIAPAPPNLIIGQPAVAIPASLMDPAASTPTASLSPVELPGSTPPTDPVAARSRRWVRVMMGIVAIMAVLAIAAVAIAAIREDPPEIVGPRTIEAGETVRFRSAADRGANVSWTDWNGDTISQQDLQVTPVLPGELSFTMTVDGASNTRTVTVTESPIGPRIVGPDEVPVGGTAVFTANLQPDDVGSRWIDEDGNEQLGATLEFNPLTTGDAVIALIAVGADGRERGTQHAIEVVR